MNLRQFSTLQIALGASIAVHAVLLTVRLVDPEDFSRVFQDTPLEVVLVNAKTNEKPDKARAIAQASIDQRIQLRVTEEGPPLRRGALRGRGGLARGFGKTGEFGKARAERMGHRQTADGSGKGPEIGHDAQGRPRRDATSPKAARS